MNRKISVERLYPIENYANIKFSSEIDNIPDEHVLDSNVIQLLYYGQFLECDIAYKKYMELRQHIVENKVKDVLGFLQEERANTQEQIKKLILENTNKE